MKHGISKEERQRQLAQQLQNDAVRVVNDFLTDPQYADLRTEYKANFDEIVNAINDPHATLRTCSEDISALSPDIRAAIDENHLFFYELHRAIKEGMLTAEML